MTTTLFPLREKEQIRRIKETRDENSELGTWNSKLLPQTFGFHDTMMILLRRKIIPDCRGAGSGLK